MLKGNFPIQSFAGLKTPFYFYDLPLLRSTLETVKAELRPGWHMHYAVKANFNPRILSEIAAAGFGADCVSGGEIAAAIAAGFSPSGIVFAGVGKSDDEIIFALESGIGMFNVESAAELEVISGLAAERGIAAPVSLRVNPDIGAHTHANITTGLAENKFGINLEQLEGVVRLAMQLPGVCYRGLHFHIGSQITDMSDFQALCNRINGLQDAFERAGMPLGDINVGGGLGINYEHPNHLFMADFASYFGVFRRHLRLRHGQQLHFELGRALVAPCGTLISRVLYVKEGTYKRFAIIDASMTELIRPALYHAYHRVENLGRFSPSDTFDGGSIPVTSAPLPAFDGGSPPITATPSATFDGGSTPVTSAPLPAFDGGAPPITATPSATFDGGSTPVTTPGALPGAEPSREPHRVSSPWPAADHARIDERPEVVYDVVGPVCESSDTFAKNLALEECHRGDFIAIRSTGAYGESMSSHYNCRPLPGSFFQE